MSENDLGASPSKAFAFVVPLSVVLYILSFGPLAFLQMKGVVQAPMPLWLDYAYRPLFWLQEHSPMGGVLNEYVGWWLRLARPV